MIQLQGEQSSLTYEFDWDQELSPGITLTGVTYHEAGSSDLTITSGPIDIGQSRSYVTVGGCIAGKLYRLVATAQLSDGELVEGSMTLRGVGAI